MSDDSLLSQLAEEFTRRVREGKLPEIEEYASRYPELAGRIRELFPTLMLLEGMAATSDSAAVEALPSELAAGSGFGQYRIEREIGRGGMGIVYEATHVLLEKRVALKVLPVRTPVDAAHLERFFREARTAAGLHHTNIVPVFDVGQVSGTPYYAMQYIEGRGLDRILKLMQAAGEHANSADAPSTDAMGEAPRESPTASITQTTARERRGPRPPSGSDASGRIRAGLPARQEDCFRWVAGIGIQAAEGLAYAHQRKVVHRDIKPSNLLLDNEGVLWIADFGLARKIEDPAMTQSGTLIGTPRYMSPEQAEAAKRPVDQRSDIYSLGATLYELLTCKAVFEGKTPQEVLSQILAREPVAPRRLNSAIPADLETVVMKAMAKRPEDRYQSAQDLAGDLQRWLKLEPIRARRIGPLGRTVRWCRRNPKLAAVTAAAAAIILALSGFYYWSLIQENADTRAALGREQEARNQTAAALLKAEASRQQEQAARAQADESRKSAVKERDSAQTARNQAQAALDRAKRQNYAANLVAAGLYLRDNHTSEARQRLDLCDPSLRGWEWRHLFLRSDSSLATLHCWTGTTATLPYPNSTFGFTNDAKRFSWNTQYTLHVWDLGSYRPVAVYGRFGPILAVNRDGTRVLSDYPKERLMRVIDPVAWKTVASLSSTGERIWCAAFSADGTRVATGAASGAVLLWDAASGKMLARMDGAKDWVRSIAFSPDGTRVAAGMTEKTVRLYDVLSGKTERVIRATGRVESIAFSSDGARLAAGTWDGEILVSDAAAGSQTALLKGHRTAVLSIGFSPDGSRIVSAGMDATVRIWDASSGEEIATLLGHSDDLMVLSAAFTPDGSRVLSGDQLGYVRVWDAGRDQGTRSFQGQVGGGTAAVFSPDGARIALAADNNTIRLWDADSGREICAFGGHGLSITSVAFSPDGQRLVSGSVDKTACVWDIQSGKAITTMRGHLEGITSVAFSPDGRRVLTGSRDKTVRVWNAATGTAILTIALVGPVNSVAFSPDGRRILTGSGDPERAPFKGDPVQLWSAATGANLANLNLDKVDETGGKSPAGSVAFSPDGRRIAASFIAYPYLGVWDARSGVLLATLTGIRAWTVSFSPNGKRILSGNQDGTISLWDALFYEPLLTLPGRESRADSYSVFSPDGSRILSKQSNGILILDSRSSYPPEVSSLVSSLIRKLAFSEDVIRALQSDTRLDRETRSAALRRVETGGDSPPQLNTDAWAIVRAPGAGAASYARALRMAERASRLIPRNATYTNTLAAAQYRVGAYQDALATLERCAQLRESPAAADLAFISMAHFKLGEVDSARAALEQLRALMKEGTRPSNAAFQRLLREAEALVGRR